VNVCCKVQDVYAVLEDGPALLSPPPPYSPPPQQHQLAAQPENLADESNVEHVLASDNPTNTSMMRDATADAAVAPRMSQFISTFTTVTLCEHSSVCLSYSFIVLKL